jgi:hypothetical protein
MTGLSVRIDFGPWPSWRANARSTAAETSAVLNLPFSFPSLVIGGEPWKAQPTPTYSQHTGIIRAYGFQI